MDGFASERGSTVQARWLDTGHRRSRADKISRASCSTGFRAISFDDETATYRMRAFNDGRFLESEVKLLDQDKAISWGFALGQITTKSVLRINESGEWTELAEIKIGSEPPKP